MTNYNGGDIPPEDLGQLTDKPDLEWEKRPVIGDTVYEELLDEGQPLSVGDIKELVKGIADNYDYVADLSDKIKREIDRRSQNSSTKVLKSDPNYGPTKAAMLRLFPDTAVITDDYIEITYAQYNQCVENVKDARSEYVENDVISPSKIGNMINNFNQKGEAADANLNKHLTDLFSKMSAPPNSATSNFKIAENLDMDQFETEMLNMLWDKLKDKAEDLVKLYYKPLTEAIKILEKQVK